MRYLAIAIVPLALALAACDTVPPYDEPYGPSDYPPAPYPEPYPAPYPGPAPYPQPYPGPAPYPVPPITGDYRAFGTEPFWDLVIGRDLVFTDRGTGVAIVQPTPVATSTASARIYRTPRLEVTITNARCSDGMSDRAYPDTVQVQADGRLYRGCGGAGDPLGPIGSEPAGTDPNPLDGTNWRVVAINRMPTPSGGNYSINFEETRLGARFGCNSLGAGYTWDGTSIDAGAIMATKMACSDPAATFETQGLRILELPMRSHWLSGERISLSNSAGSIDLVRN